MSSEGPRVRMRAGALGRGAALVALLSGVAGFLLGRFTAPQPTSPSPLPTSSVPSPPSIVSALTFCGGKLICDLGFPVPAPPLPDGVTVTFDKPERTVDRVTIQGMIRVMADVGVASIEIGVAALGADRAEVGSDTARLHGAYDPPLRQGDAGTFLISFPVSAAPTAIAWRDPVFVVVPSPPKIDASPQPLALPSGLDRATALELKVRRRVLSSALHLHGEASIENTGQSTLSELSLRVRSKLQPGTTADVEVVGAYGIPMRPGERRVVDYDLFDVKEDGGVDVFEVTAIR